MSIARKTIIVAVAAVLTAAGYAGAYTEHPAKTMKELCRNPRIRLLEVTNLDKTKGVIIYLFGNGPVIESGQTVAGVGDGSLWGCRLEESLPEPKREVPDLNPGEPFAAGRR